jgi:hypothetical protein
MEVDYQLHAPAALHSGIVIGSSRCGPSANAGRPACSPATVLTDLLWLQDDKFLKTKVLNIK